MSDKGFSALRALFRMRSAAHRCAQVREHALREGAQETARLGRQHTSRQHAGSHCERSTDRSNETWA